jgi:hypothetical protein
MLRVRAGAISRRLVSREEAGYRSAQPGAVERLCEGGFAGPHDAVMSSAFPQLAARVGVTHIKSGMRLHGERYAVGVERTCMRRKVRKQNRSCVGWRLNDLVLVRAGARDLLPFDDVVARRYLIDVPADAPALFRLAHHGRPGPARSTDGQSRRRPLESCRRRPRARVFRAARSSRVRHRRLRHSR